MPNPRQMAALVGLAGRRLVGRMRRGDRARIALSVFGVALAITFMVVVAGISVGLTTQSSVYGSDVDYWITPESSSSSAMPVSVGGPEFGAVHPTTERIRALDGVRYASPVKAELVQLHNADADQRQYVLLLGVIPAPDQEIGGLPVSALEPGDPYYADGSYEGPWTRELVLSDAAATLLDAEPGTTLSTTASGAAETGSRTFTVTNVSRSSVESGTGPLPIGVVHLAELQTLTGGASQDSADRFLVKTNEPGVADELRDIYPQSRVVAQSGVGSGDVTASNLALAIALTAFAVALFVGALFVTTALGLEITAERAQYATLSALGLSTRSQSLVVVTQTLLVTLTGGLIGILLGYGGIALTNQLSVRYIGVQVAAATPLIALYALAVALGIGVLSSPYLVWLTSRTAPLQILD